jgi:hypothetical protein
MSPTGNIVTSNLRPTSGSVIGLYPFNDLSTGTATLLISPSSVGWAAGGYGEVRLGDTNHYLRATNASGVLLNTVNRLTLTGADVNITDNGSTTYFSIGTTNTDPIGNNLYGLNFGSGANSGSMNLFADSSSGNLKVGRSSDGDVCKFWRNTPAVNAVGSITVTAAGTAYNIVSDRRLKQDIVEAKDALEIVNLIKVYNYTFRADERKVKCTGVLADELREIVPAAVTGPEDVNAVDEDGNIDPLMVDYSKIVPHLVKAVQELTASLEQCSRRIGELERLVSRQK